MHAILLSTLCVSAAGFSVPLLASRTDKLRCSSPEAVLGRRAVAGALIPAVFLGPKSAQAFAYAGEIRKANQTAIGVSRVDIPKKGEGNKGANIPAVKLDTSGWSASNPLAKKAGANSNSGPNGFYGGGESEAEKMALLGKKGVKGPTARIFTSGSGPGNTGLDLWDPPSKPKVQASSE